VIDLYHEGRILYVSMHDVSQGDGPGVNEREFALSLRQTLGSRVHLLIPTPRHSCPEVNTEQTTFYRNPWKWDLIGFLRQQFELNRQIRRLVDRRPFDLIVVRERVLPLGFYLARNTHVPYAVKTAGDGRGFTDNVGFKGRIARLLAPLNLLLLRKILNRALAVDACTESLLRLQEREYGVPRERLLLVGNATNLERFSPRDIQSTRRLIHIDRFGPILGYAGCRPDERGGMQMLEVASRLLDDYPQLGVVIAGAPGAESLRKRARELGIEDRAVIPGQVPYEQIPAYVNSFDVCFALDRPDRFRRVGNSYQKVRQALANGKPVVTYAAKGTALVQEGLVEVSHPHDLDSIEKAVRRILARDEDTKRLHAARAIAYAREHLSLQAALDRRLDFWKRRLWEEGNGRANREAGLHRASPVRQKDQIAVEGSRLAAVLRPAQSRTRKSKSQTEIRQR